MDDFADYSTGMILKAMGKTPDTNLASAEFDELSRHYETILLDRSNVAPKELEAYLVINQCHTYEELAELIIKREKKNLSDEEHQKFIGSLRVRAHRGREKVINSVAKIYGTNI